ncbi:deazapurine DNA modification protein DpdA family protein [Amycolatopsis magusensis]
MRALAARGLSLHGFGVKIIGLARYADALASSDSAAWNLRGRHVPGCANPTACSLLSPGTTALSAHQIGPKNAAHPSAPNRCLAENRSNSS